MEFRYIKGLRWTVRDCLRTYHSEIAKYTETTLEIGMKTTQLHLTDTIRGPNGRSRAGPRSGARNTRYLMDEMVAGGRLGQTWPPRPIETGVWAPVETVSVPKNA